LAAPLDDADIYLSILVLGQIRKGVERARLKDPTQARSLENWVAAVAKAFTERILAIDKYVADEWVAIGQYRPLTHYSPGPQRCTR
jgi:toxin FitB